MGETLQWPKEGEDVKQVNPFELDEGDQVYIQHGYGISVLVIGAAPEQANSPRPITLVNPNGTCDNPQFIASDKQATVRSLADESGTGSYRYYSSPTKRTAFPLNGITRIRIVRKNQASA